MIAEKNRSNIIHKAIFLDFDGVLFDTVKEAYCVCMFTKGWAKSPRDLDFKSAHFKIFKNYRFLITCAGDYHYLLEAIDKKIKNNRVNIKKEFTLQLKPGFKGRGLFEKTFIEKREYIKNNYFKYWLSLNEPCSFLRKIAKIINKRREYFFIITTKDRKTVSRLLRRNKVKFLEGNIYDRKCYKKFVSKGRIIEFIKNKHHITRGIFLDDSKEHLSSCGRIGGIITVEAGWGYTFSPNAHNNEGEVLGSIKKLLGD